MSEVIEGVLSSTKLPIMPCLRNLNLSKNRIYHIEPRAFSSCPSLEKLDLSDNEICEIAGCEQILDLQTLNVSKNALKNVSGIGQLRNLEILDISDNKISNVVSLRPLSLNVSLTKLFIEGNGVARKAQCRPSLISFVPHLSFLDSKELPPSSARKALHRRRMGMPDGTW